MGQEPALALDPDFVELMAALEREWPARTAALRASGVPLNEGDDDDDDGDDDDGDDDEGSSGSTTPPWGDDFDPERAWKLVQNLRGDNEKLKKDRDGFAAKVKEHDDAAKTDVQKLEERATSAESTAQTATREAARLRVALKKGLTESQAKRLVGDTEEELEQDADELLASFKTDDDDGQDPLRRPRERLRPGATGSSEAEETDPAKLAAKVPRSFHL